MYTEYVNMMMFLQVGGKDHTNTRYKVLQSNWLLFRKNLAILLQNILTFITLYIRI